MRLQEQMKQELYYYSLKKEKIQNNYLKSKQNIKNMNTGEVYSLNYSFESKQKEYVKVIEQKVNALVSISVNCNLTPIFCTLTLPSQFHLFKALKNGKLIKNKNFVFNSLEESIQKGYNKLKNIYRVFYKRVKNHSKNIYFIKVIEPHKTLIPHMHIMLFVEKTILNKTKELFFKVCKENQLKRVEFDESLLTTNIHNAVGYIMKYILKTLNSKDEYFKRWLDGWRKKFQIRACEMSNLPLNIEIYKKLYYNLPINLKESIQKEIESQNKSFFEYFIKNTEIHQIIYKEDKM